MRPVVSALFVVNRLSLKSIAVVKRGNILSRDSGQRLKPTVTQDAGVTGHFDENVFKTELETERPVPLIFARNNRARRVNILKADRLTDRGIRPEHDKNTQGNRQPEHIPASRGLADRPDCLSKQRHRWSPESFRVERITVFLSRWPESAEAYGGHRIHANERPLLAEERTRVGHIYDATSSFCPSAKRKERKPHEHQR
jgi:hypothetical protein